MWQSWRFGVEAAITLHTLSVTAGGLPGSERTGAGILISNFRTVKKFLSLTLLF